MPQFRTDEVHRCLEAQSGSAYEVEVCVATTATYGEKFRGVCRHRCEYCSCWAQKPDLLSNLKKCQRGILMPQTNACDRLKADGPQWSTWKADFALVYVAPVNGLLKKAIERGVDCYAAGCSMYFCRKGLCSVIDVLEHLNISGLQSH